jgi:hypothetical protein
MTLSANSAALLGVLRDQKLLSQRSLRTAEEFAEKNKALL